MIWSTAAIYALLLLSMAVMCVGLNSINNKLKKILMTENELAAALTALTTQVTSINTAVQTLETEIQTAGSNVPQNVVDAFTGLQTAVAAGMALIPPTPPAS